MAHKWGDAFVHDGLHDVQNAFAHYVSQKMLFRVRMVHFGLSKKFVRTTAENEDLMRGHPVDAVGVVVEEEAFVLNEAANFTDFVKRDYSRQDAEIGHWLHLGDL